MLHMSQTLRTRLTLIGVAFSLLIAALACNLTDNATTPTLVLRPTATPPPTIGYATLSPEELPQQAPTLAPRTETQMLSLINQVQTDRLMQNVWTLVNFGTRHILSPANLPDRGIGAARQYVLDQFNQIAVNSRGNFSVDQQPVPVNFAGTNVTGVNIIGIIPGEEIGGGIIVLGAHYDSITLNVEDGNAYAPGANDNATGIAALLEIARILSQDRYRATIVFVAFDAEEIGREGSKLFVEQYVRPQGLDIRAMINLDIIGSNTAPNGAIDPTSIRVFSEGPNDSASRRLARSLGLLAQQYMPDLRIYVENSVDRPSRYGDHMSFSDAGYPAVRFIETLEDTNRQHTDLDNLDDIQPGYLTQNTQMLLTLMLSLADGPRPPANIVLREEGNSLRTLLWDPVPDAAAYIIAFRRPGSTEYAQALRWADVSNRSVTWDGFIPQNFEAVAIATENSRGVVGPLSSEYIIIR